MCLLRVLLINQSNADAVQMLMLFSQLVATHHIKKNNHDTTSVMVDDNGQ